MVQLPAIFTVGGFPVRLLPTAAASCSCAHAPPSETLRECLTMLVVLPSPRADAEGRFARKLLDELLLWHV